MKKARNKNAAKKAGGSVKTKPASAAAAQGHISNGMVDKQPQVKQQAAVANGMFLYTDDAWSLRYFDPNDLHFKEREVSRLTCVYPLHPSRIEFLSRPRVSGGPSQRHLAGGHDGFDNVLNCQPIEAIDGSCTACKSVREPTGFARQPGAQHRNVPRQPAERQVRGWTEQ